jgi:hypothetical protein
MTVHNGPELLDTGVGYQQIAVPAFQHREAKLAFAAPLLHAEKRIIVTLQLLRTRSTAKSCRNQLFHAWSWNGKRALRVQGMRVIMNADKMAISSDSNTEIGLLSNCERYWTLTITIQILSTFRCIFRLF